jgi:hypothetical protein
MTTTRPDAHAARPFTETRRFRLMRGVMGAANPFIRSLLGSRFAGPMGRALVLLRFRGRRTGRTFTTPVGYVREGDRVVIVTSPAYRWWRNVDGGADVELRLDGRWRRGRAELLRPDDPGYDESVALQVRVRGPRMLQGFGIPVDEAGRIPDAARATATEKAHIVRVTLEPGT